MYTIITNITGTKNLLINIFAASFITLIAVGLIALVANCIIDPSHIKNASF